MHAGDRRVRYGLPAAIVACTAVGWIVATPLSPLSGLSSPAEAQAIARCLSAIPSTASVAASDHFVPHLSHRTRIYPLFVRDTAQYVAIDTRSAVGRKAVRRLDESTSPPYRNVCLAQGVVVMKALPGNAAS